MKNNIKMIQSSLEKEIMYAEKYKKILDKWSNFNRGDPDNLLSIIRTAIEDSFILSMAKIFANSEEASLWRFIQLASNEKETYKNKIKEIQGKLEPFRNIERAHNMPWRTDNQSTLEFKEWLRFAEKVYVETLESIRETAYPLNELIPEEFDQQIDIYLDNIYFGRTNSNPVNSRVLLK